MQLWQWIRHRVATLDGVQVTRELVASMLDEEVERLREQLLAQAHDRVAAAATSWSAAASRTIFRRSSPWTATTTTWSNAPRADRGRLGDRVCRDPVRGGSTGSIVKR
jgi:malate synthase